MVTYLDIGNFLLEFFPENFTGTLLEVGAAHPTMASISFPFREKGWSVISVEPNPEFINNFQELGLPLLPYACTSEDKGITTFKISPNSFSCSSLEVKEGYRGFMDWTDENFRTIEVEALKLDTILEKHHPDLEKIDILIIDTEGWELEVLAGFNLDKYNPPVVCLENFTGSGKYIYYMLERGYKLVRKEVQDEFYTRL